MAYFWESRKTGRARCFENLPVSRRTSGLLFGVTVVRKKTFMDLKKPSLEYLPGYKDALERGWSPDNLRDAVRLEELDQIAQDQRAFIASLDDPEAKGAPIQLPDGSTVQRLPGFRRWLWDGEFCGSIGFRWKPGTPELPSTCPGHIGYAVVPWKRGNGYATEALRLLLPEAKAVGLPHVEITTAADNEPSQRVILANGGVLVERYRKGVELGGDESLRFRIDLNRVLESKPKINVRRAVLADRPFVESVYFDTQRPIIEKLFGWRGDEIERSKFDDVYNEGDSEIISLNGEDIGWMSVRRMRDGSFDLDALYLLPAAQNKGVGTTLVRRIVGRALAMGASLTVSTAKINPARKLYERLGFVATHETEFKVFMEYGRRHSVQRER